MTDSTILLGRLAQFVRAAVVGDGDERSARQARAYAAAIVVDAQDLEDGQAVQTAAENAIRRLDLARDSAEWRRRNGVK